MRKKIYLLMALVRAANNVPVTLNLLMGGTTKNAERLSIYAE